MEQSADAAAMIGGFKVVSVISETGMGTIYKCYDEPLDRYVAVKVLSQDLCKDESFVKRFMREAQAAAGLNHPNITQIYGISEEKGKHYFVMEYVEGRTLEEMVEEEQLDVNEAIDYIIQAARGLKAAQERNIIHRDVKPANFMTTKDGLLKVMDFGLAKQLSSNVNLTMPGTILGTPLYMSPEQGRAEKVDFRSDMYSLGATLYNLLTGRPPFDGDTPVSLLLKHASDPVPPIRRFNSSVPHSLCDVVDRMLAKSPESRYPSYDELIAELEQVKTAPRRYAGLGIRFLSLSIDAIIFLAVVYLPLHKAAGAIFDEGRAESLARIVVFLALFIYNAIMHSRCRQTLGEKIVKILVIRSDGSNVDYFRSAVRSLIMLCVCIWPVNVLFTLIHPKKKSLHDLACDTVVIYKDA